LDGVVAVAMAKHPGVRFATCRALADASRQACQGVQATTVAAATEPQVRLPDRTLSGPTAADPAPPLQSGNRSRRSLWLGIGLAAALVAAGAGALVVFAM